MTETLVLGPADAETAAAMKALGDPIRWSVVQLLAHGERCVCDLEDALGISQSRLSYHLAILRDAEVVAHRKSGRWVYYSLDPQTVERAVDVLGALTRSWNREGRHRRARPC
ncbi:MAG: metalloregulator ArsR/SmtB family transcription factor [Longimicrobiales bacterium]|nr:metalloregulator ArsR/SmtB family transcription factor [Longimicrobiales bacterium]